MKKTVLILVLSGVLAACASKPYHIPQAPTGKECTSVGEVTGKSGGMLLFGFIPIKRNGMLERAHKEALEAGGGDVLLNPVYRDKWAWTPVGNLFFVSVKGTAAKCNK